MLRRDKSFLNRTQIKKLRYEKVFYIVNADTDVCYRNNQVLI